MLIANFIIDIVYVMVDPRTRLGMQGARRERHAERQQGRGSPGEGELAVTQVAGAVTPAASIPPAPRGR